MHFVTSAQAEDHVTDDNDAHLLAGIIGSGNYVLPVRDMFAATLIDTNTLRVLGGDASICGRHVAIDDDYEEVSIENGTPGLNREDLVVIHVELDPDPLCCLLVYKGEETTGTPVRPGYIAGDLNDGDTVAEMPVCAVKVEGINPQAPESLLAESKSIAMLTEELKDVRETLSQAKPRLEQTTPKLLGTATLTYGNVRRYDNGTCEITLSTPGTTALPVGNKALGTLPVGYRPAASCYFQFTAYFSAAANGFLRLYVGADGSVSVFNYGKAEQPNVVASFIYNAGSDLPKS